MKKRYQLAYAIGLTCSMAWVHAMQPDQPSRIVIIIDDIGNNYEQGIAALALPGPITYAVLPFSVHGQVLAEAAAQQGSEVMLHAPMANTRHKPLGPGGLTERQSEYELKTTLRQSLDWVPHAIGFNNHMGSLLTQKKRPMQWAMEVAKERRLFFVDSRTTASSVALSTAHEAGVPALTRDVFIDHQKDQRFMQTQFERAIRIARKFGKALIIGHPYPSTTRFLAQAIPSLDEQGIQLVSVSAMLMIQADAETRQADKAGVAPSAATVQQACYTWDGTPCTEPVLVR